MAEKRRRQQETAVSVTKRSKSKKNSPTQSDVASPRVPDNDTFDVDAKLELNAGDIDLKPYLDPLLRNVGGNLKNLSHEQVNNGN
jgi:phage gp29-like protein